MLRDEQPAPGLDLWHKVANPRGHRRGCISRVSGAYLTIREAPSRKSDRTRIRIGVHRRAADERPMTQLGSWDTRLWTRDVRTRHVQAILDAMAYTGRI
jgi:hypothetical protein